MSEFCKGLILVIVGIFFIFLFFILLNETIYGQNWGESIQFRVIFIGVLILIGLSILGIFNIYDNFIKYVSSKKAVKHMFSNIITITLAVIGIIGIICSILFGNLYIYYKEIEDRPSSTIEDSKKVNMTIYEGFVWIVYCGYFLFFMLSFFISPLYNKL